MVLVGIPISVAITQTISGTTLIGSQEIKSEIVGSSANKIIKMPTPTVMEIQE
ncbi:hypothetical protein E1B28_011132 [Marasmius oreades]|uniref:Uncharacterized protein n=1 Tax=Marasmius oreades TaxID=181124 RepID=A0A9P7UP82_9AGAR|nr:uncharacterized protein E1B28_011132 [Marasmius oreades]KAG7089447.1 hypothetical protein E1B28_011132 [Marasmius oreades]